MQFRLYFNWKSLDRYHPLYGQEEPVDEHGEDWSHRCCSCKRGPKETYKAAILGLVAVSALIILLMINDQQNITCDSTYPPSTGFEKFSPLLERVDIKTQTQTFDSSVWPGEHPSIYRRPPSPEVDAEWERISNVHNIAISSQEVMALGKDPLKTVKAPLGWGLGDDAHLGLLNVLHQTHCLNMLRKTVYYNHYYRKLRGFGDEPPDNYKAIYYSHLDHCLHFLLQSVTCNADMTVTTYNWMQNRTKPNPDFGINHQCRDFESIVSWQAQNHVDVNVPWEKEVARNEAFGPVEGDFVLPRKPRKDKSFWDVD